MTVKSSQAYTLASGGTRLAQLTCSVSEKEISHVYQHFHGCNGCIRRLHSLQTTPESRLHMHPSRHDSEQHRLTPRMPMVYTEQDVVFP
jgi:hypothetical protein